MTCAFENDYDIGYLQRLPERLVLEGYRHWAAGYATGSIQPWECARINFEHLLGPKSARLVVAELAQWVRAICMYRPSGVEFFPSGCEHICRDECLAIAMIAAAQHGDEQTCHSAAQWMTGSHGVLFAMEAARDFAASLKALNQILLPVPYHAIAEIQSRNGPANASTARLH